MRHLQPFRVLPLLLLLAIPAFLLAPLAVGKEATYGPPRHAYQGKVTLTPGDDAELELSIGDKVKGKTKIHATDWFGGHAISGQVDVENTTDEKLHFSYHLTFFDADGALVGCASQHLDVDAKEAFSVGGAVIHLPPAAIRRITRYQIAWYEDTQKIGKR